MIVVMEKTASEEQIEHVSARIHELGLKSHIIRGTERTVIAAIGDERKIKVESFESASGVSEVLPILAPYKIASRELKPEPSRVEVMKFKAGAEPSG